MRYTLEGLYKKAIKEGIVITGEEKTKEEVIVNNIIAYMDKEKMSSEQQSEYFRCCRLYLHYENTKNIGNDFIFGGLSLTGLISSLTCYLTEKDNLFIAAVVATFISMGLHSWFNNINQNIYEEDMEIFEDVRDEELVIRDAVNHMKLKKLL